MSSLTVRRLATECRGPRALGDVAGTADAIARGRMRDDLGARIGPSLDRGGEVVRIRRLPVRVAMPWSAFSETALAEAWTAAFVRSLFQALACPGGSVAPFTVARWPSRAAQLAALARDVLSGDAAGRWEYAEFRESGVFDDARLVFALCATPGELRELLALLAAEESDPLARLLASMDDAALDALIERLSFADSAHAITARDVEAAIAPALRFHAASSRRVPSTDETALRRLALRSYAAQPVTERSARALLHALRAAVILAGGFDGRDLPAEAAARIARLIGVPAAEVLRAASSGGRAIATLAAEHMPDALRATVAAFAAAMQIARTDADATPWIASPTAALFLLAPLVPLDSCRTGFSRSGRAEARPTFERERQLLLIAIARAVIRIAYDAVDDDDPAPALFGGCLGVLDRAALREFERVNAARCRDAAAALVGELRARIRGFRKAPLPSIVRQFVARPGRIRVEERRVRVVLDPSPFHVALQLSGAVESMASVDWLGGRALEIALEGL